MTDPSGSSTYSYDQMGRITTLAKTIGSTNFSIGYTYNAGGQLTQIAYPSGRSIYYTYDTVGHLCMVSAAAAACRPTSSYLFIPSARYDAANRPLSALYGNGILATAAYTPARSQLASLSYGGAVSTASSSATIYHGPCGLSCPIPKATFTVTSSTGFNVNDEATVTGNSDSTLNGTWTVIAVPSGTEIELGVPGANFGTGSGGTITDDNVPNSPLFSLNYYYQQNSTYCPNGPAGNNGQIQCINDKVQPSRSATYTYDFLGRLSTANTAGTTPYAAWGVSETYDRYGNRPTQSVTKGSAPAPSFSISPANNQINTGGYQYDASGNLAVTPNPGGTSYTYDGEECLTNYTSAASGATYTCDGNGVRLEKVVTGANAVTTVAVYSGGRVIAEYDNGAAVTLPTREYIYGNNLLATVTGSTGGTGGTIVYQHRDELSPRLYTSSTGADIGEQGTFPFGETWYSNGTTSNWVFTTYERDAESGNDNAMARSYANSQARFLSPDPVEGDPSNPQSWNRYAYVGNDPVNVTDPSGKNWLLDLLAGFIGVVSADPAIGAALFGLGEDGTYWAVLQVWGDELAAGSATSLGANLAAGAVSAAGSTSFLSGGLTAVVMAGEIII